MRNRYLRQTILQEIGLAGQQRLSQARVLCVGAGGLGSPAALYLAAAGIGTIGLMDPDRVEESNLQRQVLFDEKDVGALKVERAAERLAQMNSTIQIQALPQKLSAGNALRVFADYDVILDGTDNFSSKFLINDAAVRMGRPVVYASISRMEGQLSVFWANHGPCYRCLYPSPPETWIPNCAESGVLGAVAGVIGSMQAMEAIKLILGLPSLAGRLLVWDAIRMEARTVALQRRPDCEVCSIARQSIELIETTEQCERAWQREQNVMFRELSASELMEMIQSHPTQLIDVREEDEWRQSHLLGALHFPLSQFQGGHWPSFDPSKKIVLYCQSGIRSRQALEILTQKNAIPNVELAHLKGGLEGGLGAWTRDLVWNETSVSD